MASTDRLNVARHGAVATVAVERPAVLNALDPPMLEGLIDALQDLGEDRSVGAVVLGGEGRAFMAGADVRAMAGMSPVEFRRFVKRIQDLTRVIRGVPVPVVAAVGGLAVGAGSEIVCACDLRVASTEASFSFPEARLGLVVTSGASYLLPRLVGRGWARYLLLTGETISSEVAHRIGLVQVLTDPESLMVEAVGLAARMTEGERLAMTLSRRLLDLGEEDSLEPVLRREVESILSCFTEGEATEGLAAFLEKRKPRYRTESLR